MRVRSLLVLLLALAAPASFAHEGHGTINDDPAPLPGEPSMRGAYGGPFLLTDESGKTVSDETYHGKYVLLTFGYTSCGDICPMLLKSMSGALDALGDKAAQVQPLFITLDPDNDTPAHLKDALSAIDPRIMGLTGPGDYLDSAARKYRIRVEKTVSGGMTMYDHTAVIFLMGTDGGFLERFPRTVPAAKIAERIRLRMSQPATAP